MRSVWVLNGPNLNLLGTREPDVYGRDTLADVQARCERTAAAAGLAAVCRQSNHEGTLVDWIQEAGAEVRAGRCVGLVLNAGAYTHTSVALRDAITGAQVPTVEVHVTNVHRREDFRHHSYLSAVALGVIVGFGVLGYELAVQALAAAAPPD